MGTDLLGTEGLALFEALCNPMIMAVKDIVEL